MTEAAYTVSIINCRKGSAAYHHERRHEWQEEEWGVLSFAAKYQFLVWTFCFACLWNPFLLHFGVLLFSAWYLFELFLEADAVVHSIRVVGLKRWLKES